ncbi:Lipid droplet-associated hydrolase [Mytilus coruscus]|uniref:Lipid droplet-associated hydrolase n=1 Tax=Mytilus coruscus TaxID=42192 RepID=A0A6J8ABE3_MYTCO|nr:Lipid droplet-associated hydrolase [Mytilus coruscus]
MEDIHRKSEIVHILGMPTHILKYGIIGQSGVIFLIIPGNPGIAEYYDEFMKVLYQNSKNTIPVWTISHAGHVSIPKSADNLAIEKASYSVCSLEGQIKHKLTFIKDNIPTNVKLVLIGHSIGCYMILKLLDDLDQQVLRCFMLFPTIERMAESPKGQVATPLLKYLRWLGALIVQGLSYLSPHMQFRLILWYFRGKTVPDCIYNASMSLFDSFCVSNVMYMANMEMQRVKKLDEDLIKRHLSKISFYYGSDDHWCPKSYYYEFKEKFPHADTRLCTDDHDHAFVLEGSKQMADILSSWVERDLHKIND